MYFDSFCRPLRLRPTRNSIFVFFFWGGSRQEWRFTNSWTSVGVWVYLCVCVCECVCFFEEGATPCGTRGAHESNGMFCQWKTDCSLFRLLNTINCSLCVLSCEVQNKDKNLSMHAKPREEQEKWKRKRNKKGETQEMKTQLNFQNRKSKSEIKFGQRRYKLDFIYLVFFFFFLGSVSRILFSKYQNEFWIEPSIFVLNVSLFIVFRFYAMRVTSLRFSIKQDFDLNLNELNEISVYSVVLFLTVVVVVDWTWTRNIWKVWEKNLHC